MYQYTEFDQAFVRTRAAQYRDQLERNLAGTLPATGTKPSAAPTPPMLKKNT